jgi:hypothetical protein
MVEAGATMKQKQCGLFPHSGTVRHQLRTLNIEKQPHPIDEYMHGLAPCEFAIRLAKPLACLEGILVDLRHETSGSGTSHIFGVLHLPMCSAFDVTPISSGQNVIQFS